MKVRVHIWNENEFCDNNVYTDVFFIAPPKKEDRIIFSKAMIDELYDKLSTNYNARHYFGHKVWEGFRKKNTPQNEIARHIDIEECNIVMTCVHDFNEDIYRIEVGDYDDYFRIFEED